MNVREILSAKPKCNGRSGRTLAMCLHHEWMKDPAYVAEYEKGRAEFWATYAAMPDAEWEWEREERELWDVTLGDGLEDEP